MSLVRRVCAVAWNATASERTRTWISVRIDHLLGRPRTTQERAVTKKTRGSDDPEAVPGYVAARDPDAPREARPGRRAAAIARQRSGRLFRRRGLRPASRAGRGCPRGAVDRFHRAVAGSRARRARRSPLRRAA